jgi:hypothetical protein
MMKTIKDNGLNTELQELYLVNKQWLQDLEFLDTELRFLENRFAESFAPLMSKNNVATMKELLMAATSIDKVNLLLKKEIYSFLKQIEGQLLKQEADFGLELLERHAQLMNEITEIMQAYHLIKSKVFKLAQKALKSDPYLNVRAIG